MQNIFIAASGTGIGKTLITTGYAGNYVRPGKK